VGCNEGVFIISCEPSERPAVGWSDLLGRVRSECFKPGFIYGDVLNHFGLRAETKFFELVGELVAVNEVNRGRAVSGGFLNGVA
jgi:hypothetical protein